VYAQVTSAAIPAVIPIASVRVSLVMPGRVHGPCHASHGQAWTV
jgi:hypothetical protein